MLPLSLLVDTTVVSISNSLLSCSQDIAFTEFSENLTSDLEVKVTEMQTHLKFLVAAPFV